MNRVANLTVGQIGRAAPNERWTTTVTIEGFVSDLQARGRQKSCKISGL